jgi:hypothetical protein
MASKTKKLKSETSPEILMLAYLCIKGTDSTTEKVSILDRFGLSDADIALVSNCAVQSVRNSRLGSPK